MKPEDVPWEWLKVACEAMGFDPHIGAGAVMRPVLAAVAPLIAAAERERCRKIATELEVPKHLLSDGDEASKFGDMIAAAIRATPPGDKP